MNIGTAILLLNMNAFLKPAWKNFKLGRNCKIFDSNSKMNVIDEVTLSALFFVMYVFS